MYPKMFNPTPNIDPRVQTPGSTYMVWQGYGVYSPEYLRRGRAGWEWCYAPFKRTGDIYGRDKFWDYTIALPPIKKFLDFRPGDISAKEFRDERKKMFVNRDIAYDNAMMFYVPACVWCERVLAEKEYPDAIINEKGFDCAHDSAWVTGHDKEVRIFPGENKYGNVAREDLKNILLENDISGFAFDCATGEATVHRCV